MKAIVAVDEKWGIGKNGDLLIHIPGDLKYFREMTIGKVLIVGRKTLESFPGGKPLPGRLTIVLTENPKYNNDQCFVFKNLQNPEDIKTFCGEIEASCSQDLQTNVSAWDFEDIFVAGGGSIYKKFLPCCEELLITKIEGDYNADTFFPNIDDSDEFFLSWESKLHEENGIKYKFTKYERKK